MNEQTAIQTTLRKALTELQGKNPRYSVRALAMKLGMTASATNEILKGERRVSRKLAERICRGLLLDPTERNEVLKRFPERRQNKTSAREGSDTVGGDYLKLTADQFRMISDWIHYAILSLIKTADFRPASDWIAQRLNVTISQAAGALERLERLGLIHYQEDGSIQRTPMRLNTTDDVLDVSIQKSHLTDMELASKSLLKHPVHLRDFTSLTIAISPQLLPQAKELIRKAQDEICDLMAAEVPSEVYRLSVYLFPLTQPQELNPITPKKEKGEIL